MRARALGRLAQAEERILRTCYVIQFWGEQRTVATVLLVLVLAIYLFFALCAVHGWSRFSLSVRVRTHPPGQERRLCAVRDSVCSRIVPSDSLLVGLVDPR